MGGGLVLMLQRVKASESSTRERAKFNEKEFFEYFASEFFEKTGAGTQSFLLKTSLLPRVSPDAAVSLTGNKEAKKLLADLCENHFFTERRSLSDPVYQYHPLFRSICLPGRRKRLLRRTSGAAMPGGRIAGEHGRSRTRRTSTQPRMHGRASSGSFWRTRGQ